MIGDSALGESARCLKECKRGSADAFGVTCRQDKSSWALVSASFPSHLDVCLADPSHSQAEFEERRVRGLERLCAVGGVISSPGSTPA